MFSRFLLQRLGCLGFRVPICTCISAPDASRKEGFSPQRWSTEAQCVGMGIHLYPAAHFRPQMAETHFFCLWCSILFMISRPSPRHPASAEPSLEPGWGGVVAMDQTGSVKIEKGLGTSGATLERGWCFLQLPGFSESSLVPMTVVVLMLDFSFKELLLLKTDVSKYACVHIGIYVYMHIQACKVHACYQWEELELMALNLRSFLGRGSTWPPAVSQ